MVLNKLLRGKRVIGLFLVVLSGTLLRLWVSHHLLIVSNDAAGGYLYQARELLRGHWKEGLGTYFPPGLPILIALVSLSGWIWSWQVD